MFGFVQTPYENVLLDSIEYSVGNLYTIEYSVGFVFQQNILVYYSNLTAIIILFIMMLAIHPPLHHLSCYTKANWMHIVRSDTTNCFKCGQQIYHCDSLHPFHWLCRRGLKCISCLLATTSHGNWCPIWIISSWWAITSSQRNSWAFTPIATILPIELLGIWKYKTLVL